MNKKMRAIRFSLITLLGIVILLVVASLLIGYPFEPLPYITGEFLRNKEYKHPVIEGVLENADVEYVWRSLERDMVCGVIDNIDCLGVEKVKYHVRSVDFVVEDVETTISSRSYFRIDKIENQDRYVFTYNYHLGSVDSHRTSDMYFSRIHRYVLKQESVQ